MNPTTLVLNWTSGSRLPMAALAWALFGQVCSDQLLWMKQSLKHIYSGVTVFPGKKFLVEIWDSLVCSQSFRLVPSENWRVSPSYIVSGTRIWGTELRARSRYWTGEFQGFYNPATGFDIDGAWIDMNEPASVRRTRFLFRRPHTCIHLCRISSAYTLAMIPSPRPSRTTSLPPVPPRRLTLTLLF